MKTPTAKQLFDQMLEKNIEATSTEMMIEFAKLHVEAALKEVCEIVCNAEPNFPKSWVLNSYPFTNIK